MIAAITIISNKAKAYISAGFVAVLLVGSILYINYPTDKHLVFAFDNSNPNGGLLYSCTCTNITTQGNVGIYHWQPDTPGKICPSVATLKAKGYPCP
jgi:hypothetical protein